MRASEFILLEAAWDAMVDRITRQYDNEPQVVAMLTQNVEWAKNTLKKSDRVIWWIRIVEKEIKGDKLREGMTWWRATLAHLMGIRYDPIQNMVFGTASPDVVLNKLYDLENEYNEKTAAKSPVQMQPGDRVIKDWGNGMQWVYTDRAFCADEGRSGKHCGNVTGHDKPEQRILSLRKNGHVELTFILEKSGYLGEMKGRGNTKPTVAHHPYIMWLLEQPFVKGIAGGGYDPSANFSIRDLTDEQIAHLRKVNPDLDIDRDLNFKVLALEPHNESVVKDILDAVNEYLIDKLDMVWYDPSSQEGNGSAYNFLEFVEWTDDYHEWDEEMGDEEGYDKPTLKDIPSFMLNIIEGLANVEYSKSGSERYTEEQWDKMYTFCSHFTVQAIADQQKRTGQWRLVWGTGTVKTGKFRF